MGGILNLTECRIMKEIASGHVEEGVSNLG